MELREILSVILPENPFFELMEHPPTNANRRVRGLKFSPEGLLATASENGCAYVLDQAGNVVNRKCKHYSKFTDVDYCCDKFVFTYYASRIYVYSIAEDSWSSINGFGEHYIGVKAFESGLLVAGRDYEMIDWNGNIIWASSVAGGSLGGVPEVYHPNGDINQQTMNADRIEFYVFVPVLKWGKTVTEIEPGIYLGRPRRTLGPGGFTVAKVTYIMNNDNTNIGNARNGTQRRGRRLWEARNGFTNDLFNNIRAVKIKKIKDVEILDNGILSVKLIERRNHTLLALGGTRSVLLYNIDDPENPRLLWRSDIITPPTDDERAGAYKIDISPDESYLVASDTIGKKIHILDIETGTPVLERSFEDNVWAVAWGLNNKIAVGLENGKVYVFDVIE